MGQNQFHHDVPSRRDFIRTTVGVVGSSLAATGLLSKTSQAQPSESKSLVALSQDTKVIGAGREIAQDRMREMLDACMKQVTGESSSALAYKSLFKPRDIVGIKVNCLAGRNLSSHPDLVKLIIEHLLAAAVPARNIIVWERLGRELEQAGFPLSRDGSAPRCMGTDDPTVGYDAMPTESGSIGSCFSRFLSSICTALISVPILKDHDLSGVSIGMKNFYGGIHNPNKYHDNNCDPYIADLNAHPFIRGKLKLTICDATTVQYHGGPSFKESWAWSYGAVLVSRDPVALDRVGADLIENKRKESGLPSLKEEGREPRYIQTAATRGLGVGDSSRIEVVRV
ncbi:MAG TPA: DUF362 domain-containing protein [bacterium]|nr:DUF362 domain-containing protein [bacterium]